MANIYISSVGWTAVAQWAALTGYVSTSNGGRGDYVRQLAAPAVNSERVYRCTVSGTSGAAEPAAFATGTKNQVIAGDGTVTWTECTGQEADQIAGTWKAPHARLAAAQAATWSAAGDTYFYDSLHAETQATAMTHTFPGTLASPNQLIGVLVAGGTVPPLAAQITSNAITSAVATPNFTTTGNSAIVLVGCAYCYGAIWSCGTTGVSPVFGLGGTTQTDLYLSSCALRIAATLNPTLTFGTGSNNIGARIILDNVTCQIASASASAGLAVVNGGDLTWRNSPTFFTGGTIPANIFPGSASGGNAGTVVLGPGNDYTSINGKTLIGALTKGGKFYIIDDKEPGTLTLTAPVSAAVDLYRIRSSSTAQPYLMEHWNAYGKMLTETTIVRSGGALVSGTNISFKLTGSANANWQAPFRAGPFIVNNSSTATNVTVTMYCVWDGGGLPNNDQVWMEVQYMGSAATPIGTLNSGTKATFLTAGAAQASDSSSWGGSTTVFKLVTVLSSPQPGMVGAFYCFVNNATTTNVYVETTPYLS